jgi:serine protease Do
VPVDWRPGLVAATVCDTTTERRALNFMRAVECLLAKPACWFLAAVLTARLAPAAILPTASADTPRTNRTVPSAKSAPSQKADDADKTSLPAVPRPTPAYRSDLRPAFSKAVPVTLDDLKTMERHVKALAARVSPAVVAVEVGSGTGSGVVISADGLVLTAGHVCSEPNRDASFTFPDGRKARGKTVGVNLENDTGLMRITDRGSWPHADMGDLRQALVGDWVLALGHPGGFDLRRSLVVRLGRIIRMDAGALQTDCTISPGDSGGPLFDMHGRVIGIHSAISTSMADNFHVTVTAFYDGWERLVRAPGPKNEADHAQAYVGATGVDDADGCRLTKVDEDGPAAKAGLKPGDLVVKVAGREVKLYASFWRWVAQAEPGDTLNIEVKRGDEVLSLELKVESPPGHN